MSMTFLAVLSVFRPLAVDERTLDDTKGLHGLRTAICRRGETQRSDGCAQTASGLFAIDGVDAWTRLYGTATGSSSADCGRYAK